MNETRMTTILVAEDERDVLNYLGVALSSHGYCVELAQNGEEALECIRQDENHVSAVLLDISMPYKDGLQTLQEMRTLRPDLPVIMVSGADSPLNIVTAMKMGASDFLSKPVNHLDLCRAVEKILPPGTRNSHEAAPAVVGTAPWGVGVWSQKLELLLRKVGPSDVSVLLRGETGVGKEVVARKLHALSPRAKGPFLKLNCAALPSELVESELFGYERGAFTGAFKTTPGKFEIANGGVILLDEIGDMDCNIQAKLLQVIQDREFSRLGAKETFRVDVRVMAATHRNLQEEITAGRFREDLYYRLNIIDIYIPPLRNRQAEILPLAEYFLQTHATLNEPTLDIPPVLREALVEYRWPGNIRELENVMRKYLVLRDADALASELSRKTRKTKFAAGYSAQTNELASRNEAEVPDSTALEEFNSTSAEPDHPDSSILNEVQSAHKAAEAEAILAALNASRWNRKQAAAWLKIDYKALLYKMKKLGIGQKVSAAGR